MDILKVIHDRRSVRRYKPDPVPEEVLREILEAARRAPSWANTQVWRFIVVKDSAVKDGLLGCLGPTNPARAAIIEAPVVICVAAKKGLSGCHGGTPTTNKGDWFMFDAAIAMEHIVLTGWSFGLGTVYVGSFDARKAEGVLAIPEDHSICAMTPLGYFDEVPRETPRKPLAEIVFSNTFGDPYYR